MICGVIANETTSYPSLNEEDGSNHRLSYGPLTNRIVGYNIYPHFPVAVQFYPTVISIGLYY